MYTRCTHCGTAFAVQAEQLRSGRGTVRCGHCLEAFDALEQLSDSVPGPETPMAASASPGSSPEDPGPAGPEPGDSGSRPDPGAGGTGAEPQLAVHAETGSTGAPDPASPERGEAGAVAAGEAYDAVPGAERISFTALPPRRPGRAVPVLEERRAQEGGEDGQDVVPEVLREDLARMEAARAAARARIGYALASVVLLLGLAAQYAWFMPGDLLHRYPQARPVLEAYCARAGCTLPERRDPSLIHLISRDVRVHPRYEGALRITATLENDAPFAQPYPRMQFTLFNVNGQVIAARRFKPREYLPSGIDRKRGMPPGTPVQIGLDVLAPEQAAVSFEFRFL